MEKHSILQLTIPKNFFDKVTNNKDYTMHQSCGNKKLILSNTDSDSDQSIIYKSKPKPFNNNIFCYSNKKETIKPVKKIPKNIHVLVKTDNGIMSLKKLKKGCTIENKQIETILCSPYFGKLVCFPENSLDNSTPCKTTYLKPNTSIFINGKYCLAKSFIGQNCISYIYVYNQLIHHILFKEKNTVKYSHNNIIVKSYNPKDKLAKKYYEKKYNIIKNKIINDKTWSDKIFGTSMKLCTFLFTG